MAEKLLDSLFKGDTNIDIFIRWLIFQDNVTEEFSCSRGEFISYFLNALHEEVPCSEIPETPHKKKTVDLATPSNRKRQSLFQENTKPQLNKSQTFPPINSTPKLVKTISNTSVYESPISPLYRNQNGNFSTPKINQSSLCLGDFIVQKSTGKKKEKRSRRINPTSCLKESNKLSFEKCNNSFDFNQEVKEIPAEDTRSFLKEECMRMVSRGGFTSSTPQKIKKTSISLVNEILVDLNLVTQRDKLDVLVRLYSVILQNNLALNLSSELYFIVSLLFRKSFDFGDVDGVAILNESSDCVLQDVLMKASLFKQIFCSIHNVIYFSVKTIENLIDVFKVFDKATIKLLAEHISTFSPNLSKKLTTIFYDKIETTQEIFDDGNAEVNVCFISDTDNRANFPNDQSFCAFRKQRDLFYEILRIWEMNHLTSGWCFNMALGGKIRALLALHHESVNFMHLARLFKNQLLSTYGKENLAETEPLSFLSTIPNVNIDKVNRLKSRLVTKQTPNSINPSPEFTGLQEFYRDFLLVASSHIFIQHIKDVLIAEIFQLNDTNFSSNELENDGNKVDVSTKKSFLACIKSLRVLAKFLGFVEGLPYRLDSIPSEIVVTTQVNIRQQSQSNLDVMQLLSNAITKKTLVLTIPWLTKYLSMLDYVTLRLPYFLKLFKQLFCIYRTVEMRENNLDSVMLIKFCLGWLFELPNVPGSLYYNFEEPSEKLILNELCLVDQNVLMVCCPYLKEIKKILFANAVGNVGATVKHITPLTAVQSPAKIARKRLEMQLEEAFFNGQPISMRKTVEFVSERIASTCVKHLCNSVVPNFKKQALADWKKTLEANKPISENARQQFKRKSHELATECLKNLLKICRNEIQTIIKEKIPVSIEALLALDVLPQTKTACTSIASRLCMERTEEWICSHVVIGIFTKDFESELNKYIYDNVKKPKEKAAVQLPFGGRNVVHNEAAYSGECLVGRIRDICLELIEQGEAVDTRQINNLLEEALKTVTERCDINDCILNTVHTLSVDLFLLLIVHKTTTALQTNTQNAFKKIWKTYSGNTDNFFKSLICPRNVMFLAQSGNVAKAWDALAKFSAFLLKEQLMTCETFETQCVGIFKYEWEADTLQHLTNCFNAFLKYYANSNSKFTLLVEFLAEFCCDVDFD